MDTERLGELVGNSITAGSPLTAEAVASVLTDGELLAAVQERGLSAGPLATTEVISVTESAADTTDTTAVDTELTPEQHERTGVLQTALAEKFSTDERKLTPEDFGLVAVGEGEARQVLVMLTTGNGLYHGSWNTVMSYKKANTAKYTIEVDGQTVDTRTAMTWEAYQALIAQADAPLPDSQALSAENGKPWAATWLTGEQPVDLDAQYGYVGDGEPCRYWRFRDIGWYDFRFRPAAVV